MALLVALSTTQGHLVLPLARLVAAWAAILAWVVAWIACLVVPVLLLLQGLRPMPFLAVHLSVGRRPARQDRLRWRRAWLRVTAPR